MIFVEMTDKKKMLLPRKEDKDQPCFATATIMRQWFNVVEHLILTQGNRNKDFKWLPGNEMSWFALSWTWPQLIRFNLDSWQYSLYLYSASTLFMFFPSKLVLFFPYFFLPRILRYINYQLYWILSIQKDARTILPLWYHIAAGQNSIFFSRWSFYI